MTMMTCQIKSINLGSGQRSNRGGEVVRLSDVRRRLFEFAMFLEFLASHHDGHGGFGDEIVGEGTE